MKRRIIRRYEASAGKYDPVLYPIAIDKDRYPHATPRRLIIDFNAAEALHNRRLATFKRSRKWHDDRGRFRQKWDILENGLSPTKLEEYWARFLREHCGGNVNAYVNLVKEFNADVEELVRKHTTKKNRLDKVPFIYSRLENYLLLNSRYCNYEWKYFSGYLLAGEEDEPESLLLTPYTKLPYQVETIVPKLIRDGVPKDSPFSIEIIDHSIGKAWRLKRMD